MSAGWKSTLTRNIAIGWIFPMVVTVGCAKDPSKEAPKAQVGPVKSGASTSEGATGAPPQNTKTEKATVRTSIPLSGTLGFVGSKVTGSHTGIFKTWSGAVEMADSVEMAKLTLSADVASVFTDPENRSAYSGKLDGHLKSADFFDAGKYPKATFVSTAIEVSQKGPMTHRITGDLTMRGVTRSVTFPASISVTPKRVTGKAEFTISRSQWGIVYKGQADDLIRDGVVMKIDVAGAR